jgi:hypothetical protein
MTAYRGGQSMGVLIGIDPHKSVNAAAAIDEQGGLVTASHRTEREPGGSRYVARIVCEAEARGHRGEILGREPAQTLAQLLRCRHPNAPELVGGL